MIIVVILYTSQNLVINAFLITVIYVIKKFQTKTNVKLFNILHAKYVIICRVAVVQYATFILVNANAVQYATPTNVNVVLNVIIFLVNAVLNVIHQNACVAPTAKNIPVNVAPNVILKNVVAVKYVINTPVFVVQTAIMPIADVVLYVIVIHVFVVKFVIWLNAFVVKIAKLILANAAPIVIPWIANVAVNVDVSLVDVVI